MCADSGSAIFPSSAKRCTAAPPRTSSQLQLARSPQDSQEPTTTLKVNVNVVQLFFNVKEKHGGLVPNLKKDDFEIYEDGKPQTIKYFTAESNLPLDSGHDDRCQR